MNRTKNLMYCSLFTALIAVGAFIKIPIPVVPFTLQFLFTTLAGLLLGSKMGAVSVIAYMVLGLVGLPIFSEGGGIWYVFKPSFGYIMQYPIWQTLQVSCTTEISLRNMDGRFRKHWTSFMRFAKRSSQPASSLCILDSRTLGPVLLPGTQSVWILPRRISVHR